SEGLAPWRPYRRGVPGTPEHGPRPSSRKRHVTRRAARRRPGARCFVDGGLRSRVTHGNEIAPRRNRAARGRVRAGGKHSLGSSMAVTDACAQAEFLSTLPVAAYLTDAEGRLTYYTDRAAELWGCRPDLGTEWCSAVRLFWPDGQPMRHDECPLAVTLRDGQP